MRLKKISNDFSKYKDYEAEQKNILNTIISRINRIGDFFDSIVKFEKFMIEEIKNEYRQLVIIRQQKNEIINKIGIEEYLNKHFIPTVNSLSDKIEVSVQSWNNVEKEYTTGKMYGFISAMKNFYIDLDKVDKQEDSELHTSSMSGIIKEILDIFGNFKMYKAIMTDDIVQKIETLLSIQQYILNNGSAKENKKPITLADL